MTGAAAPAAFIAWKNAARAEVAGLDGAEAGMGEARFGRMAVIAEAFGKQG